MRKRSNEMGSLVSAALHGKYNVNNDFLTMENSGTRSDTPSFLTTKLLTQDGPKT